MNSGDESLAITGLLCPMCLDVYEGRLAKAEQVEEKDEGRQAKDIYQMERDAQEMEIRIQEALPPEKREACWLLVASVQGLAEIRARRAVGDWAEQGMLYNILMAEAWKATESYDPAKSKFSTWVFRPWGYAIKEFWRVKRLQTESLSATGSNPSNQTTLQSQIPDPASPSPDKALVSSQLSNWALELQPLLKVMIDDACQQYEWLCPFCRRGIRECSDQPISEANNREPISLEFGAKPDIHTRRYIWIGS